MMRHSPASCATNRSRHRRAAAAVSFAVCSLRALRDEPVVEREGVDRQPQLHQLAQGVGAVLPAAVEHQAVVAGRCARADSSKSARRSSIVLQLDPGVIRDGLVGAAEAADARRRRKRRAGSWREPQRTQWRTASPAAGSAVGLRPAITAHCSISGNASSAASTSPGSTRNPDTFSCRSIRPRYLSVQVASSARRFPRAIPPLPPGRSAVRREPLVRQLRGSGDTRRGDPNDATPLFPAHPRDLTPGKRRAVWQDCRHGL